jgi:parallel beta-helix repeat protein
VTKLISASTTSTRAYTAASNVVATSSTAAGNGHDGIAVFGDNNTIKSSTAVGNSVFGIFIEGGTSNKVQLSTASGNGSLGILFEGNPAKLTENQVIGNGFGACDASDLAGLGILVENLPLLKPRRGGGGSAAPTTSPADYAPPQHSCSAHSGQNTTSSPTPSE